ncbi:hypothetical protein Bhyg_12079 [Pseudolycoriella hygida]|uniref:Uncharacterized protein n=1 Tax=Pseudolycoriella hygida TaxID=35572 RepID=A0A9Q0MYA5_9DIPT|nr:hypothetical protein Bhyg_12079 [Pseudolycoriella hygida]
MSNQNPGPKLKDKVTDSNKRDMISKLKTPDGKWRRSLLPTFKELHLKGLSDLVASRSLFPLHKIDSLTFQFMLNNDPTIWPTNAEFQMVQLA